MLLIICITINTYVRERVESMIYVVLGKQVMIDSDLARLYWAKTRRLNEQVKRNIDRLPKDFMFQLTKAEIGNLMSQISTSSLSM